MLKIARYLFTWTKDAKYMDYYERAFLNGILGAARLEPDLAANVRPSHTPQQASSVKTAAQRTAKTASLPSTARKNAPNIPLPIASTNPNLLVSAYSAVTQLLQKPGSDSTVHETLTRTQRSSQLLPRLRVLTQSETRNTSKAIHHARSASDAVTSEPDVYPWVYQPLGAAVGAIAAAAAGLMPSNEVDTGGTVDAVPYGPGQFIYYQPLGAGVARGDSFFSWGTPFLSFWCCYGSSVESFSKVADSIYFTDSAQRPKVILCSKSNKICMGCFDPTNVCFIGQAQCVP